MKNPTIKTELICLTVSMSAVLVAVGWIGLCGMKNVGTSLDTGTRMGGKAVQSGIGEESTFSSGFLSRRRDMEGCE